MIKVASLHFILLLLPVVVAVAVAVASSTGSVCTQSSDCLNGGECIVLDSNGDETHSNNAGESSYCRCASNYAGTRCHTYCPIACLNGGTCEYDPPVHAPADIPLSTNYVCHCRSGWKGNSCNVAVRKCDNGLECLNGAKCRVGTTTPAAGATSNYTCECPYTHTGSQCQHAVAKVTCPDGHECVNGGSCIKSADTTSTTAATTGSSYMCSCPDSHSGDFCEVLTSSMQSVATTTTATNNDNNTTRGSVTGMVIGVMLGLVVAVVGVAMLFVKRRRRQRCKASSRTVTTVTAPGVLEADGSTTMKDVSFAAASAEHDSNAENEAEIENESGNEII